MDRILFGDNQFFGINHLSEEKARIQANRFKDIKSIIEILDYVYSIGINTFMCTTYDRVGEICDHIRANSDRYKNFKIYPCMPYAHKYANSVTELGIFGTVKKYVGANVVSSLAKGAKALVKKDVMSIMKILIDTEMSMFKNINTPVIFLQNVVTDLILGLGMSDFLIEFGNYIKEKYNAEPGYITMNFPLLLNIFREKGIENPIICSSINKINFRMSGGLDLYEKTIRENQCHLIAMQVLAAGAIPPAEAFEYICKQKGIKSILFGASTKSHVLQSKELIDKFDSIYK
jgi:hypothetical protein